MQLDQLSVVLRQRNPFEAIDLGFAMAREWWRDIYVAWLAVFMPVAVLAWLLLPPLWAALVVWWLKPAFDRVILHVVASEVFGSRPRLRTTLLSYFSYAWNGLLLSLVPLPFLRLQVTRAFDLPVRQLVGQDPQQANHVMVEARPGMGKAEVMGRQFGRRPHPGEIERNHGIPAEQAWRLFRRR